VTAGTTATVCNKAGDVSNSYGLEAFRGLRISQITGLEVEAKNENSEYR
jgi:hypothetical protein